MCIIFAAVNKFADLRADEFKARYASGYRGPQTSTTTVALTTTTSLPTTVDWVSQGAVTPVKNQEQCGASWAFSTTGAVEGITFLATSVLPVLSEQQLIDCSGTQGNDGCYSGVTNYGFQYIIDNSGITSEAQYAYIAAESVCDTDVSSVASITGFNAVPTYSDSDLMAAIAQQPVSVAIETDEAGFQFYDSGVLTGTCGTQVDHNALAVGYGTSSTNYDYYKIKNSWGTDWGATGYILIGRGSSYDIAGQCGILTAASYPVKST